LQAKANDLPAYSPHILPAGDPVVFYERRAEATLEEQLLQVIDAEGPIPEAVLFRRVARAWGLERTGVRISDRLRNLVPTSRRRTKEQETTFYWPYADSAVNTFKLRVANQEAYSRRHVEEVCIEEIMGLVQHVLNLGGSAPRPDVARSVCKLLGMARTPADAEARVGLAIDALCLSGSAAEINGSIRIAT
jgi:hypothetical protein